ncbi:MAG TPA: 50S ribosomal protein L16 [bacterium]|nr:50S ribosomal protein L16 [bacterium]HOL49381.1 50S ribosomal protein L16 [bacterium]HPO51402.1 50S ribosomal protein L16 [bacterium]
MPLMPKRVKYRKVQRGRTKGKATRGATIYFGDFGLQVLSPGRLKSNQIEAARIAITHHLKAKGKLWIRIFPDRPFTKKPAETRMGKGKGDVAGWEAIVLPGRIVFEIAGVSADVAMEALRLASYKLPIETKIVKREIQ